MQKLIISLLCLLLSGCWIAPGDEEFYKEKILNSKPIKYTEEDKDINLIRKTQFSDITIHIDENGIPVPEERRLRNDVCVYGLLFGSIPPLNFWDIRLSDEATVDLAIKRMKKKDSKIKGLRYLNIERGFFIFPLVPIFGWQCAEISGVPIYDNRN